MPRAKVNRSILLGFEMILDQSPMLIVSDSPLMDTVMCWPSRVRVMRRTHAKARIQTKPSCRGRSGQLVPNDCMRPYSDKLRRKQAMRLNEGYVSESA